MSDIEFDNLFRTEYPRLYRIAYSMLRDSEECKDIVSQVFADLYERPPHNTQDPGQMAGYLSRAVRSRCIDFINHLEVEQRVERFYPLEYKLQSETDHERESRLRDVKDFIDTGLTPQTRQVLLLCYDEEMSYQEAANRLGISISAINKHISQGLKALRERFTHS